MKTVEAWEGLLAFGQALETVETHPDLAEHQKAKTFSLSTDFVKFGLWT